MLRGELPTPVRLKIGLSDGTITEVVEGELAVGDVVVTDAIVSADAQKPATGAPPGASPAGGGMRRVF